MEINGKIVLNVVIKQPQDGAVGSPLHVTVALYNLPLSFPSSSIRLWRSA